MSLRRVVPDFNTLFRQIDDRLSSLLPRISSSILSPSTSAFEEPSPFFNVPSADIQETDDVFIIETELPGVPKENLSMDLTDDNTLSIRGHYESSVKTPSAGKRHSYWAKERMAGDFRRSFTFPFKVEVDKIKASLKDGVLKVEVAKAERPEKSVPISIASEGTQ